MKKNNTLTVNVDEIEITGIFTPAEAMVMYYKDGSGYPGSSAEFEITNIVDNGVDVKPIMDTMAKIVVDSQKKDIGAKINLLEEMDELGVEMSENVFSFVETFDILIHRIQKLNSNQKIDIWSELENLCFEKMMIKI